MGNTTNKMVTYDKYNDRIFIWVLYADNTVKGRLQIINTPLGFEITIYHDAWKILSDCRDLFEMLSSQSMSGITMETLVKMINDIGYKEG